MSLVYATGSSGVGLEAAVSTAGQLADPSTRNVVVIVPPSVALPPGRASTGADIGRIHELAARLGVQATVCVSPRGSTARAIGRLAGDRLPLVVVGGRAGRWFWPSADERLVRALARRRYRVVFVDAARAPQAAAGA